MKDIFLETFDEDMQKICNEKNKKCENSYNKTREQNLRIHDEFWNSLDDEQKNKYRDFENILYSENLETEEEIYIFALKKGIAIGFEVGKSFYNKQ